MINFRISYGINSEVKRESLIRKTLDAIVSERIAYERYEKTRSPQDETALERQMLLEFVCKKFIKYSF
ncbi:hypothetical protein VB002_03910 [Campylobacter concisus]